MNKTYEPKTFEKDIYAFWQENKLFNAYNKSDKPSFTMVMPPPNITGQLHMGHALNNTLQDILARYKRMMGHETLWLPGTDHASIATEVKITEELTANGIDKKQLGREGFLVKAFEWNDKYGNRIVEQLQQLGSSCDWDRKAFTMDENCSKAVLEAFEILYNKGLIYRGERMISWCSECLTALSDAEVEHQENDGSLWYIKYPLVEDAYKYIMVATTRPETILGDTAVAVNPTDKRYKSLIGKMIALPLTNRQIPIIADDYVDAKFGTGAVKITPSHDPNDFEIGSRHSLERIEVMDNRGKMNEKAGDYSGLDRFIARKKMVEDLNSLGLLEKIETRNNNVGVCYRCKTIVEPRVSLQWFVKMTELVKPATEAVKKGDIKFSPKRFEKIYLHWLNNIKDWCISRQLWWGHRIPAYICDKCGFTVVSKEQITEGAKCIKCSNGILIQDPDVLDTWFSSALWPFSTLGWPNKTADLAKFYPGDVLVTGYDIIFFWVARMVFSGLKFMKAKPFSTVLIHGLVRDEKGQKMSKSAGNGIDPLEIIDKYGADAFRFSLTLGIATGADQRFLSEKIDSCRNFMNKIYNAGKFVLVATESLDKDFDFTLEAHSKHFSIADKWILTKLAEVQKQVSKALDKFETGQVASLLYDFTWDTFCDWYIESSKVTINGTDIQKANATRAVLAFVYRQILTLLHPFVPYITEYIYQEIPNKTTNSIMTANYNAKIKSYKKETNNYEAVIIKLVNSLRQFRANEKIPPNNHFEVLFYSHPNGEKLIKEAMPFISKLASVKGAFSTTSSLDSQKYIQIVDVFATMFIPKSAIKNDAEELERLKKEFVYAQKELILAENKLKNEGFVAKAPKALLELEQAKIEKYTALRDKILDAIGQLEVNK